MIYNKIPPDLFNQPNIAKSKTASKALAIIFTKIKVEINTSKNAIAGSHTIEKSECFCIKAASFSLKYMAAIKPAICPIKEKRAAIRPFFKPLRTAPKIRRMKNTSRSM